MVVRNLLAALLVLPCCWSAAEAASPRRWSSSTADALATGTLEGTFIDGEGSIGLARQGRTLWGPDSGIVWTVAAGRGGAYVGLSGPGRVLRVDSDGDDVETLLDIGADSLITAIANAPKRGIFVGRSPEGEILHVVGPGEVRSRGLTDARFVWALAIDERGELWIGTGLPGRVLRNPDSGVMVEAFASGDDPVRSLAAFPGGGVVAGTGGRGRVIRIDVQNRPFVLYDAEEEEIVALAVSDDGTVFALAAGGAKQVRAPAVTPRTTDNAVTVTATAPGDDATPAPDAPSTEAEPVKPQVTGVAGGALYRIDPSGDVRRIWMTRTELPFDLLLTPDDALLIATGEQGRIHHVDREGRATWVRRVPANQASGLAMDGDGRLFVGGSTDARLEVIEPETGREGTYTTAAIDAGTVAQWGRLAWQSTTPEGASIAFALRAGNTDEPDETWTEWIGLNGDGEGDLSDVPSTRWCQVRATLRAAEDDAASGPQLSELALHYLPRNRPPVVEEFKIEPAGVVWSKGPIQPNAGRGPVVADDPVARSAADSLSRNRRRQPPIRRSYEFGARTFAWRAQDPDADRLTFALDVRAADAESWLPLAREIETPFFSWDTRAMPDGAYRMRLVAEDRRDNPDGEALRVESISEVFHIDGSRPHIDGWRQERGAIAFDAVDEGGRIVAVQIAWDGGPWEAITPADGVADSAHESYRVEVDAGRESIRVRVVDAVGNIGGEARLLTAEP